MTFYFLSIVALTLFFASVAAGAAAHGGRDGMAFSFGFMAAIALLAVLVSGPAVYKADREAAKQAAADAAR